MNEVFSALERAAVLGAPLLIATLGEVYAERAGVTNLGVEGMMAMGALGAFTAAQATGNPWLGILAALVVGGISALLHAFVSISLRANQFVSGLALSLLGVGTAGLLGKRFEGQPLENPLPEWVFLAFGLVLTGLLTFHLYHTRGGLILRSSGENPASVDALGINVFRVRYFAVCFGGVLAGLAGAFYPLASSPSWSDGITGGQGWIAVALTIFALWNPARALFGALFFGLLYYLAFRLQNTIPSEFLQMMPFLLVIVALALGGLAKRRGAAPEALGLAYARGER